MFSSIMERDANAAIRAAGNNVYAAAFGMADQFNSYLQRTLSH